MRLLFMALAVLFAANVQAQRDKAEVDVFTATVVKLVLGNGAESVFTHSAYCDGNIKMFILTDGSRCSSRGTYYKVGVFYLQDDKPMVTFVDNCGIFEPIQLQDRSVFDYYQQEKETLMLSSIKEYETDVPYDEPKSRTAVYRCHRDFGFYTSNSERKVNYSEYWLTNDPEHPNKNLEYNKTHPLNNMDQMLKPLVEGLEADGKLIRQ